MFFLNCMGAFKGKSMVTLSHQSNLHLDFQRCFKSTHSFEIGMVKNESNAIRMNRMTFHEGTVPFRKLTWQGKHSPKDSIEVLQGGTSKHIPHRSQMAIQDTRGSGPGMPPWTTKTCVCRVNCGNIPMAFGWNMINVLKLSLNKHVRR